MTDKWNVIYVLCELDTQQKKERKGVKDKSPIMALSFRGAFYIPV